MKKYTKAQKQAVEEILVETGIILDWLGDKAAYVDRFLGDIMLSSSLMSSVSINFSNSPNVLKFSYSEEYGSSSTVYLVRKRSVYVLVESYSYEDEYEMYQQGMEVKVGTKAAILKEYNKKYNIALSQINAANSDLLK